MNNRSPLSLLIRGFLLVVVIVLAVVALISIISWWAGWMYLEDFQRAVILAGILLDGIGLVGLLKVLLPVRRSRLADDLSEPIEIEDTGTHVMLSTWLRRYAFPAIFWVAGVVCLLIGFLLV